MERSRPEESGHTASRCPALDGRNHLEARGSECVLSAAAPEPARVVTAVDLPGPVLFLQGVSPQITVEKVVGSKSRHLNIERDSPGASVAGRVLYVLEETGHNAQPRLLFDAGTGWIGTTCSVSYDGQTVYFAMATPDDPFYHLYSIPVVGGPPKQLTSAHFTTE